MPKISRRRACAAFAVPSAGALALSLGLAAAGPSQALTIVPLYDTSVTSLANAVAVQSAFNLVARDYATSFSNPATVYVNVSWGSVAGQALPSTAVGASVDSLYGYFSYGQVRNDLAGFSAANPSDTALATAMKSMSTTAPAGPSRWVIPSAEAKALGLISPTKTGADGSIGFAGSTSGYDFNPTDGVTAGTYDFEAVAAHELAEVLGRISGIDSATPAWRTPFDLYRYTRAGSVSYGYNDTAYFSIDGGVTDLRDFNNSSVGGDRGDWLSTPAFFDVSNAFIATGRSYALTAVDLTALDVLGWGGKNLGGAGVSNPNGTAFSLISEDAVPEPAAWTLLIAGFGLTGATLRHRRRDLVRVRTR